MRRLALLVVAATLLGGCALNDRFTYAREDPFIWFLSGMPAPYDLNWQKNEIPDLPVLNPPDYAPAPPMQPLDYPRGWNPDHPPLITPDAGNPNPPQPSAADTAVPQPAQCGDACDAQTVAPADPVPGADGDAAGDARRAVSARG
jgi:hypothetical protein